MGNEESAPGRARTSCRNAMTPKDNGQSDERRIKRQGSRNTVYRKMRGSLKRRREKERGRDREDRKRKKDGKEKREEAKRRGDKQRK